MSAPRDSSSSTNSSCPPAHASVRAVSWLLSVSESTSMQEKGAWEHGVPGYGVPEGYWATPGHKISNYLSFIITNIQTLTKPAASGFNKFICFHSFQSILKSEVTHGSFKFLQIFRWFTHLKFLGLEPETDICGQTCFLICNFDARTFFRLAFRQKFTS